MLKSIHLSNFTIASDVTLHLNEGMTAITGETGAGKSIMVDALKLLSGQRAEEGWIREGQDRSTISAFFDVTRLPGARAVLEEIGQVSDDEIILRRSLQRGGRSRNSINGHPVSLAEMEKLSKTLLEICSQHAHIQLLDRRHQMKMVDNLACAYFSDGHRIMAELAKAFRAWRAADQQLDETRKQIEDNISQHQLLTYQLEELDALQPQPFEYQEISKSYDELSNAGKHREVILSSAVYLAGGNRKDGAIDMIGHAINQLESGDLKREGVLQTIEALKAAKIEVQEAHSDLESEANGIEDNPSKLDEYGKRVEHYFRLSRKHMVAPEQLIDLQERVQVALDDIPTAGDLEPLAKAVEEALAVYKGYANEAHKLRAASGDMLSSEVETVLKAIGLNKSRVQVSITDGPMTARGTDTVELLFSANVGQTPKPLAKVASGGELSRVALAFQVIEAEHGAMPTIIFDEVDVGISGDAARKVGEMLARLGQSSQCVVITHQAPVANSAHHHFRVSKLHGESETTTRLDVLEKDERIEEIKRMMGVEI
jgi:DNA repair protein RecN (Recombination protein N)